MRMLPVGIALASLLLVGDARAVDLPGWNGDSRVRQVIYRADEVVRVEAQRGFATHIALGSHEHIQVVAPGDRDGWQVVANKGDHDVYLKPQLAAHDSNLEIRTDRHSYSFDLVVLPLKSKFGNDRVMYRVTFVYPDKLAKRASGESDVELVAKRLAQPAAVRNARYSMQVMPNSDDIAPTAAWDDGRFTYLRIPNNRRMPAIFRVADDGTESVVDKHIDGDTIVVHEVAKRFVLRLAREVVGIWNDAYDIDGVPAHDGTTVNGVKRILRSHRDE
ncbi:type IV secretion system protein VirB9 [Burkholderia ubonensis]|uniref:TrbG/VirB9 family P-type conjugative transfer protein n=1 Tax=Burkholderia ubonensis TaxID=101571 RepID=UPI000BA7D852|nr:TrbG/VirB9 family P-type conjugative transfer protein [Burkholderia ubonensis]PAK12569.1 type IV secretion system protein VirB9 [Burkholderia ubonensis]RQP87497.1 type IV secretion system protein VirB9 [Burkholderia ubonensis]